MNVCDDVSRPSQDTPTRGSGGISTIVLKADGSFSQLIQVHSTDSTPDSASPVWSQIKRGRFVAAQREIETGDVLELEFHASGVETHGAGDYHGGSLASSSGLSLVKDDATSEVLNQRWNARLECE